MFNSLPCQVPQEDLHQEIYLGPFLILIKESFCFSNSINLLPFFVKKLNLIIIYY